MKKSYNAPQLDIIKLQQDDIITMSTGFTVENPNGGFDRVDGDRQDWFD